MQVELVIALLPFLRFTPLQSSVCSMYLSGCISQAAKFLKTCFSSPGMTSQWRIKTERHAKRVSKLLANATCLLVVREWREFA